VLQAATGITARYGTPDAPVLHGIAFCVDYITGFSAALGIAQATVARELGRGGAHVRTSLSMGAQLVQFPFTVTSPGHNRPAEPSGQQALGHGAHNRRYRARDGWVYFACRAGDLEIAAHSLGAAEATHAGLSEAFAAMTRAEAAERLRAIATAAGVPVRRLDGLREGCTIEAPPGIWQCFAPRTRADTRSACRFRHGIGLNPEPSRRSRALPRQERTREAF
jgi:crotonobetainyl-CoA:carnitine CoA-transferase CaiB-like acyl-CoA transferase